MEPQHRHLHHLCCCHLLLLLLLCLLVLVRQSLLGILGSWWQHTGETGLLLDHA
jgi:hypothetical protein